MTAGKLKETQKCSLNPGSKDSNELRLGSMAAAFLEQQKDAKLGSLTIDERFAMLVDAEHLARDNGCVKAMLREAELRIAAACSTLGAR